MTENFIVTDDLVIHALIACGNSEPTKKHFAIMRALLSVIESNPESLHIRLSRREKTCLFWVAHGKSAAAISELMGIRKPTVASYIRRLKSKLKSKTLAQAVFMALRHKEIDIEKLDFLKRKVVRT